MNLLSFLNMKKMYNGNLVFYVKESKEKKIGNMYKRLVSMARAVWVSMCGYSFNE